MRGDDGVAVADFGGIFHLHADFRQFFNEVTANQAGVPRGAAGHKDDVVGIEQMFLVFDDAAEAQEYLDSYYDVLIADGFIKSASSAYISKDAGEEYSARLDSDVIDGKVYIEFWYTEYLSDEEVVSWMDGYDFPSIDVAHLETIARDATKYYEYDSNVYQNDILSLDVTFASVDERNEYMTSFVLRLLNEEGFEEVDARKVKVARRDTAFYNASKGLIIAYNDNNTQQIVNFHLIKVADSFSPLP